MSLKNMRKLAIITGLYITSALTGTASAAEDYTTWTYNADVTLNTSSTGAAVNGTVTSFPVLVRLSYKNFLFNEAKGNGADIRFAKAGLPLSYQIERWDSAGEAADIWVKLDTVKGNTAGQVIKMYWGQASAADSSNAAAVFDTANGFAAVWHLHKAQTDATINANVGTNNGATDAPGMIGGARHFQADSSQFIEVNYSSSLALGNMTFSAWTKQDVPGNARGIIGTRVNGEYTFDLKWMPGGLHGDIGDGTTWFSTSVDYDVTPEPAKWFYVTYVMGTNGYKIYLDGDSVKAEAYVGTPALMVAGESLRIGHTGYGGEYFSGVIDEPRIDKVMRSSDWIKLSYANQNAKQTLVTLLMTNRCVASFVAPNDTTLNEGAALVLNPTTACASSIAWSVASGPATTIPDPEAKSLMLKLPRVTKDTTLVLRLSVTNTAGVQQKDIKVNIKEASPDPVFTFPTGLTWNGTDTMSIIPSITNLAAIKASPYPSMTWVWTIPVLYADTASFEGGMLLKSGYDGDLQLNLCLDNGGAQNCQTVSIIVSIPVSLALKPHRTSGLLYQPQFDIMGRRMADQEKSSRPGRPLFFRPELAGAGVNHPGVK